MRPYVLPVGPGPSWVLVLIGGIADRDLLAVVQIGLDSGLWFLVGGHKNKYGHTLAWCAHRLYIRPMFNLNLLSIMTSTFEEITARGPIHEIVVSERVHDLFIVTFADGSQANADYSTLVRLCIDGVWSPLANRLYYRSRRF